MYTIKQAAEIFQVHYRTILNWIKAEKIKAVKVSRTIRITEEEIERVKNTFGFEQTQQNGKNNRKKE